MKTKALSLAAVFMLSILTVFAAEKTVQFKVKGSEACKSHIEEAAKSVDGVINADWNNETRQLEVVFNDEQTKQENIEMAIAKAGHDTENMTAKDAGYEKETHDCNEEKPENKAGEPQKENKDEW